MAGFLTGAYIWFASVLACGGVAAALVDALGAIVPALAGAGARVAMLVLVFGALVLVNVRSVVLAARIIAWGTAIKLIPLALFVLIGGLWLALGHEPPAAAASAPAAGNFAEAMLLALFAFCGMETPLAASGEVRDPARTVPRATLQAMLLVLVLYLAIQFVAQGLLGPALGGSKEPLAEGGHLIHPWLGLLLFGGAALSRLAWIGSDILGAPRVLFAFGRDGFLPAALGRVHPRFATPYVAIWTHAAIAFALAATGSFVRLAIWSTLATAGLYFLACWAAWLLRRRGVAVQGTPLSFAFLPAAAAIGMASMVAIVALAKPEEIAGFAGVTLASLALYVAMRPRRAARPG
jgi:basic amino acid/polyamine antiporter, APA family